MIKTEISRRADGGICPLSVSGAGTRTEEKTAEQDGRKAAGPDDLAPGIMGIPEPAKEKYMEFPADKAYNKSGVMKKTAHETDRKDEEG